MHNERIARVAHNLREMGLAQALVSDPLSIFWSMRIHASGESLVRSSVVRRPRYRCVRPETVAGPPVAAYPRHTPPLKRRTDDAAPVPLIAPHWNVAPSSTSIVTAVPFCRFIAPSTENVPPESAIRAGPYTPSVTVRHRRPSGSKLSWAGKSGRPATTGTRARPFRCALPPCSRAHAPHVVARGHSRW